MDLEYDNVIITMGENGSILKENNKIFEIPALKVKPLNTTGAGDTFNGVLAAALLEGYNIEKAAHLASKAASISVTKEFVIDSIPFKEDIE